MGFQLGFFPYPELALTSPKGRQRAASGWGSSGSFARAGVVRVNPVIMRREWQSIRMEIAPEGMVSIIGIDTKLLAGNPKQF